MILLDSDQLQEWKLHRLGESKPERVSGLNRRGSSNSLAFVSHAIFGQGSSRVRDCDLQRTKEKTKAEVFKLTLWKMNK